MNKIPKIKVFKYDLPLEALQDVKDLAIDTEALGLNCHRDRLCTVQLLINESIVYIIHFPTSDYEAPNLKKLLSNSKIPKLFHFARFDVFIIYKYLNVLMQNVICTRVLSKIVRTYSDKHGLKHICKELLDVNLNKGEQSSNWAAETLSNTQIHYAANDVLYLHKLFNILKNMADKEDRYKVAKVVFEIIPHVVFLENNQFEPMGLIEH